MHREWKGEVISHGPLLGNHPKPPRRTPAAPRAAAFSGTWALCVNLEQPGSYVGASFLFLFSFPFQKSTCRCTRNFLSRLTSALVEKWAYASDGGVQLKRPINSHQPSNLVPLYHEDVVQMMIWLEHLLLISLIYNSKYSSVPK